MIENNILENNFKNQDNNKDNIIAEKILALKEKVIEVKNNKPTVIFDFDGVIHSYKSGWKGADIISDEPVPGIKEAIVEVREKYKVVIVSTRCYIPGGIDAIKEWLHKYDIIVDDVTAEKPAAIVIIDDRAITFDGDSSTLLCKIESFKPWNR